MWSADSKRNKCWFPAASAVVSLTAFGNGHPTSPLRSEHILALHHLGDNATFLAIAESKLAGLDSVLPEDHSRAEVLCIPLPSSRYEQANVRDMVSPWLLLLASPCLLSIYRFVPPRGAPEFWLSVFC